MLRVELVGETQQEALGNLLASHCRPPCIIYLQGDLGAGKTTLARGFLRGLGYTGKVKSPTYTLLEPYELDGLACYHFDLYRVADPEELEYLGIQDLLQERAILLVEWPERGAGVLPAPDLVITLEHAAGSRVLRMDAKSSAGSIIEERLSGAVPLIVETGDSG